MILNLDLVLIPVKISAATIILCLALLLVACASGYGLFQILRPLIRRQNSVAESDADIADAAETVASSLKSNSSKN